MFNLKPNFVRFTSHVSYIFWRFKKLVKSPKEEPKCEHCGGFLKYHAWSDCDSTQAMLHTVSSKPSDETKAFYDRFKPKQVPGDTHGADNFSCVDRGPGGTTIAD